MKDDSLEHLRSAFAEWRRGKRHARERMPEALLARARRATREHGVPAVVRVTRVERARLFRTGAAPAKAQGVTGAKSRGVGESVPTFSRLELSGPCAPSSPRARPVAEVETRLGVTLRVFEQTPEMMGLLSAVCGFGGSR